MACLSVLTSLIRWFRLLLASCRLFSALQQQLHQASGSALALLTASLPQLLPAGGNLRLWRQLGAVVQEQGSRLTAEQLCEVLPLVQVCSYGCSGSFFCLA